MTPNWEDTQMLSKSCQLQVKADGSRLMLGSGQGSGQQDSPSGPAKDSSRRLLQDMESQNQALPAQLVAIKVLPCMQPVSQSHHVRSWLNIPSTATTRLPMHDL